VHRGKHKGKLREAEKHPLRHLVRFILLAIMSESRIQETPVNSDETDDNR